MEEPFSPHRATRSPGVSGTGRHVLDADLPTATSYPRAALVLPSTPSPSVPPVEPSHDVTPSQPNTAGCSEFNHSLYPHPAASHAQPQDRVGHRTALHPRHSVGHAEAETHVVCRGGGVACASDVAPPKREDVESSDCPSCDSSSLQQPIDSVSVKPRFSPGHEAEECSQESQPQGQKDSPSAGAAKLSAADRPSKEAAICGLQDSAVHSSCSEYPQRQANKSRPKCAYPLTKFLLPWCRSCSRIGPKKVVQRSPPDRGEACTFLSSISTKRVVPKVSNKGTPEQSRGPTLHALSNEARDTAVPGRSSVFQNSAEQQCRGGEYTLSPRMISCWTIFQRFLGMPGRCASQLKGKFSTTMDRAFSRHAVLVFDYKWHFILMSFIISALMAVGLLFRKHENDMYKLYSFSGAPSYKIKDQFLSHFPRIRTSYIIAYSDYDSLTRETLLALHNIDQQIRNVTLERDAVTVDEYGNSLDRHAGFDPLVFPPAVTFEDICARDSWGDCNVMSVLDMYTSSRSWGRPIVSRNWPIVVNFRTKKAYRADAMLGNIRVVEKSQGETTLQIVQNATAFGIRYDLLGEGGWEVYSAALEERIEKIVFQSHIPGMKLALRTERSISDDLSKSSQLGQWDSILLTVAVLVVLMYTLLVNSSLNFRTKTLPAFMGVLSTLLGYAGGAGFIYLCGLLHTPPAEATPFLVLGIGVDNAFVLINSYSLTFLIADPRERIRHTTRDAGLAITCTTMTSVTALIIGAASPYASISMFCVITAFCLFWGYVMALTFFLGWLALDAQREAKQLQHRTLQCREGELTETAAKNVGNPKCVEAGGSAGPDKTVLAEAENTYPSTTLQTAEAHISQNSILYAPLEAAASSPCTVDANLSVVREQTPPCFLGKRSSTPNVTTPHGDALQQLECSRFSCTVDFEAEEHQQQPSGAQGRAVREKTEVIVRPEQASQCNHTDDGALSPSKVCVRRSKCGVCRCLRKPVSSPDEVAFLKQMKYMSTFQLASLMAFRPRLQKTLENERDGRICVQLSIPLRDNHGGCAEEVKTAHVEQDQGKTRRVPRKLKLFARATPSMKGKTMNAELSSTSPRAKYETGPRSSEGADTGNDILLGLAEETKNGQKGDFTYTSDQQRSSGSGLANASPKYLIMNASDLKHLFDSYLREPRGNVGRLGRAFLINYYCRMLGKPWIQAVVLISFAALCGISIYGFTQIQPGITVDEICPKDSYLRTFFEVRSRYFSTLGEEITVFFPEPERWEDKALQNKLVEVHDAIYSSHHAVAINNGMYHFIKQRQQDMIDGDKGHFLQALYIWLYSDLVGKQYRTHFVFSFPPSYSKDHTPPHSAGGPSVLPDSLVSWKFVYWMPHVENTSVLYEWLKETRLILQEASTHFHGLVYTPLAILWESDPYILKCTVSNLLYALVAIVLMTVVLIPNFFSMLIVALIVFLVDLALCGFMAIWGLRLNMLTMVILLLAIGYSVDTTTHVLNAFTRCCGRTRRERMVETMVLMGNAIANGMLSTLIAVFFLKGSDKFVLEVFFKMMVLVLAFAFGFGFIFLPVLLQLFGPMTQNDQVIKLLDASEELHPSSIGPHDVDNRRECLKPATLDSYAVQELIPAY